MAIRYHQRALICVGQVSMLVVYIPKHLGTYLPTLLAQVHKHVGKYRGDGWYPSMQLTSIGRGMRLSLNL